MIHILTFKYVTLNFCNGSLKFKMIINAKYWDVPQRSTYPG